MTVEQELDEELLRRAMEIVRSAYACPEWLQYARSDRTDETLNALDARLCAR